jgi:p-aminobenzoyl-glutamate transporter AbgT
VKIRGREVDVTLLAICAAFAVLGALLVVGLIAGVLERAGQ